MESIVINAPAKVNLRLEIIGKRPDGYHELSTIFQKIGLFDELILTKSAASSISLTVNNPNIASNNTNLAYRAAELLQRHCGVNFGVSIVLKKQIPAGAGLGGGSSDAAAVLDGCNRLFGLGLDLATLQRLALGLGADVPFFLAPWATANASGVGEILSQACLAPDLWFIIVFPRFSISTAWAYSTFSKDIILTKTRKNINLPYSIAGLSELRLLLHNDFERVALPRYPEIAEIKKRLVQAGADGALLSGSGSSVFGVFESNQVCLEAARQLEKTIDGDIFIAPNLR